jgi:HSP20 family protein
MAIIRWDPFRDLVTLRDRMNRLFEDAVSTARSEEKDMISSAWAPAVDIYEDESQLVLSAEVPGIEEKDIEIKVEDNTLSIRAEHENGVLKITLPKKLELKPRQVRILKPTSEEKAKK